MSSRTILIAGGSIAGMRLALEQASAGNKVYLVEQSASLACERISSDDERENLFASPLHEELKANKNIEIIGSAELERVEGTDGKFLVRVRRRASRIIDERCDDCKACIAVCPVNLWDDNNQQLVFRTAIDSPCPGAGTYDVIKDDMPVCQATCPVNLDIRGYVGLIADGRFEDALALIRERLPFPGIIGRICAHPCEQKCNRGTKDQPVAICALKRFVADFELSESARTKPTRAPQRDARVAVIGAGPAGLACAHDLAVRGYAVTVFEALPVAGGMLAVGIPDYRLPRDVLDREIKLVRDLGVEIRTNSPVGSGKGPSIENLFEQGFKAIFIGVGAHRSQKLAIPGEDADGVVDGVVFLRELNLGQEVKVGQKVAVIGGGNVAMDAARSALRLGAKNVTILYRRSRQEMPASAGEIEAAEAEGIEIRYLVAPVEIIVSGGKVAALKCSRMELGEPDASGRRRPVTVKGSEFDIDLDMVIPAIGQVTDLSFIDRGSGIETTKQGMLKVDRDTLATTKQGVFAGGDSVTGPSIAIEAVAAGKRAAAAIARYLEGE